MFVLMNEIVYVEQTSDPATSLFAIFFIAIIGVFVFQTVRYLRREMYNDAQEKQRVHTTIVNRREHANFRNNMEGNTSHTQTTYYVTFEFEDTTRLELRVPKKESGYLAVGDTGMLEYQGTRYLKFDRNQTE